MLCFYCSSQDKKGNLRSEGNRDDAYVSKGFRSWGKAMKCFEDHQDSACHKTAAAYHVVAPQCKDIAEMNNEIVVKSKLEEQKYI